MLKHFEKLIYKLEKFIKRYYYDMILKGLLIFIFQVCSLFIIFSLIEYFAYLSGAVRIIILIIFSLLNILVLIKYIIYPVLGLLKIGKSLEQAEAAKILGKHFKDEINDKILNALQLNRQLNEHDVNQDFIIAGIEQKSQKLLMYKFNNAVNIKRNIKYLPYALLYTGVVVTGILFAPGLFKEPAVRIINYEKEYFKPSPFEIKILNENLNTFRGEDITLNIEVSGRRLPDEIFIIHGDRKFRMDKNRNNEFSYHFRNLLNSFKFNLKAANFNFGPYYIDVISKPVIKSFSVSVEYPKYTKINNERFINAGDLRIAEGSSLVWNFFCEDVENITVYIDEEPFDVEKIREGNFSFQKTIRESFNYKVLTFSDDNIQGDSLNYYIEMIPDRYPIISVEEQRDPVLLSHVFFRGLINDDYGFTDLKFLYRIFDPRYQVYDNEDFNRKSLEFNKGIVNQIFYHHFDIGEIDVRPGEIVEYYFYVRDNDAINGPKKSSTSIFSYHLPTYEEIIAETSASNERIKQDIHSNIDEIRHAYEEIENIRKSMLESDQVTWEQQDAIKNLIDKKDELERAMDQLKELSEESEVKRNQFSEEDERIRKKHEELQKLFEEVLSDELKDLYRMIQEELEKLSREDMFERLDQMKFEMQDLERRLDRMLELFKQLELEKILGESIKALERAMEMQEKAIEKNVNKDESQEIKEAQEDVADMFDLTKEMLENFEQKNDELSKPNKIDDTSELSDQINKNIEDAIKELEKDRSNRAMPHQRNSINNMNKLKEALEIMKENLFYDNLYEDAHALRQLMENLLKSSFNQEALLKDVRTINVNDPKYVNYIQEQRKILADLKFVEDSLVALSKRQIHVQDFITREIAEINNNINRAIDDLVERRRHSAATRQQFAMMHINNLVLLLNESLQNMMDQLADQFGEGSGMMGEGGMPSFQNLREMQEQMNQMLEQMQQGMQAMPGETPEGQMSMSEQLARMAAEQQKIREKLKQVADEYRKDGQGIGDIDQIISDMERTELDIVRKQITRQTIMRQERILTRLLEHEKAEMEREKEEKRVGTTAKYYEISNPKEIFEYNRMRSREIEMLRSLPPGYNNFYRALIEKYFLNIETTE